MSMSGTNVNTNCNNNNSNHNFKDNNTLTHHNPSCYYNAFPKDIIFWQNYDNIEIAAKIVPFLLQQCWNPLQTYPYPIIQV